MAVHMQNLGGSSEILSYVINYISIASLWVPFSAEAQLADLNT